MKNIDTFVLPITIGWEMDGEVASLPNFKQQRKPGMDCFYDYASIMASMEKS